MVYCGIINKTTKEITLNNDLIEKIATAKALIRDIILSDDRANVIPFSAGKDSSTVNQLACEVHMELQAEGLATKPLYIISSDTTVEMPAFTTYQHHILKKMNNYMKKNGLNISAHTLSPVIDDSFWTLLLGRGYPSPTRTFRWCTERMKIRPATDFLEALIGKHSSVIMFLGVRSAESSARAQSIKKREDNFRGLNQHATVPNAFVISPIKDWSNADVWTYLSENPAPWGDHSYMMSLYDQGAGEADCNIALNPDAAECGKTRFGCWVCTVVDKDKSMQGMIDNGEVWMQPLVSFRQKLIDWREPEAQKRSSRRRNGENSPGPFTLETRKELLKELLYTQELVSALYSGDDKIDLIKEVEIEKIQQHWNEDGDIENFAISLAKKHGLLSYIEDTGEALADLIDDEDPVNKNLFLRLYEEEAYRKNIGKRYGIVNEIVSKATNFKAGEFEQTNSYEKNKPQD